MEGKVVLLVLRECKCTGVQLHDSNAKAGKDLCWQGPCSSCAPYPLIALHPPSCSLFSNRPGYSGVCREVRVLCAPAFL